jgi:hypothetical protein
MYRRVGALVAAVAFLVVVFAVSSVAAGSGSTVYLPLVAYPPTLTPTPTSTATPTPSTTFNDDFSDPNSGWVVTENDVAKVGYVSGEYQIFLKKDGYVEQVGHNYQASDLQAEVDVRDAGSTDGSSGLYFGYVLNVGFYDFEVAYGQYILNRYDVVNSSNSATLIHPTISSAIHTGNASNHLKVTRKGSVITLYANGVQLNQISDSTLGYGYVGLAASSFKPSFDARFDNFSLIEMSPQNVRQTGAELSTADGATSVMKLPAALATWSR